MTWSAQIYVNNFESLPLRRLTHKSSNRSVRSRVHIDTWNCSVLPEEDTCLDSNKVAFDNGWDIGSDRRLDNSDRGMSRWNDCPSVVRGTSISNGKVKRHRMWRLLNGGRSNSSRINRERNWREWQDGPVVPLGQSTLRWTTGGLRTFDRATTSVVAVLMARIS